MFFFTIVIILFLFCPLINAEKYYGITTGLHLSQLQNNDMDTSPFSLDTSYLKTINAGLLYGHSLSSFDYIQAELTYSIFGENVLDQGTDVNTYFNYIRFNLLYKIKLSTDKPMSLLFFVGPSVGFNTSAKIIRRNAGDDFEYVIKNAKQFDSAIMFGTGFSFLIGKVELQVEGRYLKSVSSILEDVQPRFERNSGFMANELSGKAWDWRNKVISIQLALTKNF